MFHSWNDSERYIQASVATIGTIGRKHCKKGGLQPNQFRVNIMNSVSCGLETEVKKNKNIFKKKKNLLWHENLGGELSCGLGDRQ